jgi:hypothetical protein
VSETIGVDVAKSMAWITSSTLQPLEEAVKVALRSLQPVLGMRPRCVLHLTCLGGKEGKAEVCTYILSLYMPLSLALRRVVTTW